MPTKFKVIISILILMLFGVIGLYEFSIDLRTAGWAAFFLGGFMVFSIWIFPEVSRMILSTPIERQRGALITSTSDRIKKMFALKADADVWSFCLI